MARFLLTGGTRGIGAAVLDRLVRDGHEVWGLVRPGRAAPPGLAGTLVADLADPAALRADLAQALLAPAAAPLAELDGIVHSAGVARSGLLSEATAADWTEQYATNVTAVAELTQVFLPALRARHGTVVVVNSGGGLRARSPRAPYAATKHALKAWADAIREEEPLIRVSTVYPGRTDTDMQRELVDAEHGTYAAAEYLTADTVAAVITAALLLPPDGVLTDVVLTPRSRA